VLVRQLFDAESSTYTYLVGDGQGHAALIDPVREQVERDLQVVAELGLRLALVMETHVHADHVTGAGLLRERTGATSIASSLGAPCVDRTVGGGDTVDLGPLRFDVLFTPGHTDDSVCYRCGDLVFTGDTLLIRGCGRSDFQNGDPRMLYHSITGVLFALPDDTIVYPGHDYRGLPSSTIGEEKRWNPRLVGPGGALRTEPEFVAIMQGLNLPPPRKLATAVPANRACGRVEEAKGE
jgi:sulfur dioxygenase